MRFMVKIFEWERNTQVETLTVFFESLILAQDERWRRALGMQVERMSVARH